MDRPNTVADATRSFASAVSRPSISGNAATQVSTQDNPGAARTPAQNPSTSAQVPTPVVVTETTSKESESQIVQVWELKNPVNIKLLPKTSYDWTTLGGTPGQAPDGNMFEVLSLVSNGLRKVSLSEMSFRNPDQFIAGELHKYPDAWNELTMDLVNKHEIMSWISNGVKVSPYLRHFSGGFKGQQFFHDLPPPRQFNNPPSNKDFAPFIAKTIADRLKTGAVSVWGIVGRDPPPHVVMPIVVEPKKPRMCIDMRYLNLWIQDIPFKLDKLVDVSRYLHKDDYQVKCDDKSGYDHILVYEPDRTYFGFQWGGGEFVCV
ncbi:uncharacterized protein [Ptychodera flava]|uniref:uncharacterized protein n=1 Tax=Ptychodera flava TaxID=63121 RepID=UPI00396A483B